MNEQSDAPSVVGKVALENLSKEELLEKYRGLLFIAKKAKQSKDELVQENCELKEALTRSNAQKEADQNTLKTLEEMLEQFTEQKLKTAIQLNDLQQQHKKECETSAQMGIENESLRRQLARLIDENENLLSDIERMEAQLQQVNILGKEQRQHLTMIEREMNKLKEAESHNATLQNQNTVLQEQQKSLENNLTDAKSALNALTEKYNFIKQVNTEQRHKFNALKDRFIEVHRKLKKLQDCKKILLETQHEYADAVSKWQKEIINASRKLCVQMNNLKLENECLLSKLKLQQQQQHHQTDNNNSLNEHLLELEYLTAAVYEEQRNKDSLLLNAQEDNEKLKQQLENMTNPNKYILKQDFKTYVLELESLISTVVEEQKTKEHLKTEDNIDIKQQQKHVDQFSDKNILDIKRLNQEILNLRSELNDKIQQIKDLSEENNKMNTKIGENEPKLQHLEKLCTDKSLENTKLLSALEEIEHENIKLLEQIQNYGVVEFTNKESSIMQQQTTLLDQENVILISELQAQREELEVKNAELLKRAEEAAEETAQLKNLNDNLCARFEQKEREHADLLCEMRELNEALKGRGDVITRQQEKQQDLIAELKRATTKIQQIEELLQEKSKALVGQEEQVLTLTEELQSFKKTSTTTTPTPSAALIIDDAQSDISSMSRAEEINRLREADECFEDKYNKLRGLAVKLKKKLQEQSVQISNLEESEKSYVDLQQQHKELQKLNDSLKVENQKLKSTRSKQANVLNLEIEAAEKTLKEHTEKLQIKTQELKALQEQLMREQQNMQQLRQEIALLEEDKLAECAHSKQLKDQVDLQQKQIKDALHEKQQVYEAKQQLKLQLQKQQLEIEDIKLQLSDGGRKQAEMIEKMHKKYEKLEEEYIETREAQKDAEIQLKSTLEELEQLRLEYVDYKLKAQTVLRKHQMSQENGNRVTELQAELSVIQQRVQNLLLQQQQYEQNNQKLAENLETLTAEHEELVKRHKQLLATLETLKIQNDTLSQDNRLQLLQQQEALQAQRQQMEQLNACHEQQIHELKSYYEQQMTAVKSNKLPTSTPNVVSAEQSKIDFLLMEREDAEGSEEAELALLTLAANRKISTFSRPLQQQHHEFMPLDELLNAPISAISDTVTTISGNRMGRADISNDSIGEQHEMLVETRERLQKQERQVRHLTALLAENEQDLAKLSQMNDMLKEELRRQERSVEREQHMHNSEYLKNVVLKFLTLNNNDEKTRLVPVLNTILKLSRSETEILNTVAKGHKVSNNAWSSFLHWGNGSN